VCAPTYDPSFSFGLRPCFDPLVKYKFKKGLEPFINTSGQKKAVLKPWGNLTIGFSGGLGSTVLLDLVRRCYYSADGVDEGKGNNPRNDGIWKKVTVCYVEVSEVYPEVGPTLFSRPDVC
jgi:cytoplasmic tRNA 2-thiolation protein 2